ncbi:MAG: DNA-binding protein WhiA [Defluviitaleaceae bacterium]|nr:DNA-binding protein WhiA [Defluviitaleaceae bacterium]
MSFSSIVKNEIKEKKPLSYLAKAFLEYGSITDPNKNYHLEFATDHERSKEIKEMLDDYGINAKIIKRKNSFVVYIKDGETISELLGHIGAHSSLLEFENIRIFKSISADTNRKVNFEMANMSKTAKASVNQIEYINNVLNNPNVKLSPEITLVANARLENMEFSLQELADSLRLTKSCVNHRLRKIKKLAEELKTQGT